MNKDELLAFIQGVRVRLPIDRFGLAEECAGQAVFFAEVAEKMPQLRVDAFAAKARLEFVKGDLDVKMRANPANYGLTKSTDTLIASAVTAHEDCRNAKQALNDATYLVDCLGAVLGAVEQRKSMIRDLVDLFGREYHQAQQGMPMHAETEVLAKVSAKAQEAEIIKAMDRKRTAHAPETTQNE